MLASNLFSLVELPSVNIFVSSDYTKNYKKKANAKTDLMPVAERSFKHWVLMHCEQKTIK